MIRYSPRSAKALGYLKRVYNDIEIYIEDSSNHNVALFVFQRVLGSGVKLTSINQLGRRDHVLAACRLDQADDGRKRLYIIDGDLDLLLGKRRPQLKHLYRLNAYCFENILISKETVKALALSSDPNLRPDLWEKRIDYDVWLKSISEHLYLLFFAYAAVKHLSPSIATVSLGIGELCQTSPNGLLLCRDKVMRRIRMLFRQCVSQKGYGELARTTHMLRNKKKAHMSRDRFVSGKDYLLPLLHSRLTYLVKYRGSQTQLKAAMALSYDTTCERALARRLKAIVGL